MDTRVKPENDHNNLRPQCAPDATGCLSDVYKRGTRAQKTRTLETAESGVDKVVSSCEKNPNVHKTYMNFLRQRKTALDAPLHAVSSGRSMIEMLGVLAIIGVLSVGGIAGYTKAMEKFKINKTAEQISQIVTNIRTLYSKQKNYDGLNTSNAIQMGAIPDEMGSNSSFVAGYGYANVIKNLFNGDTWIGYAVDTHYSPIFFSIIYEGLSQKTCIALSTMDWGTTDSSGLIGLAVGSNTLYSPAWKKNQHWYNGTLTKSCDYERGGEFCAKKLPLNVARAAQLCNCPNDTCQLVFTYE